MGGVWTGIKKGWMENRVRQRRGMTARVLCFVIGYPSNDVTWWTFSTSLIRSSGPCKYSGVAPTRILATVALAQKPAPPTAQRCDCHYPLLWSPDFNALLLL